MIYNFLCMENRQKTWSLPLVSRFMLQIFPFSAEYSIFSTNNQYWIFLFLFHSFICSVVFFPTYGGFFFSHSIYPLFLKPSFLPLMELGRPWTMVIKLPETITIKQPLPGTEGASDAGGQSRVTVAGKAARGASTAREKEGYPTCQELLRCR